MSIDRIPTSSSIHGATQIMKKLEPSGVCLSEGWVEGPNEDLFAEATHKDFVHTSMLLDIKA